MSTGDRDFTRVSFKVNVSGSWANLVTCTTDRIDAVKAACVVLDQAGNGAKFKILDAAGGEIERFDRNTRNGCSDWHAPRRVA